MNLGITGTGIAGCISNFIILITMLIYTNLLPEISPAVFLPDKRTFEDLYGYLQYGVPSMLMLCLDVWAGSLVMFFASIIGDLCLSA
jgi:Na+-driven multidrug efflux pump